MKNKELGEKIACSRCFFDIEFDKNAVGRIVVELFNHLAPKTCENFRSLCTGILNQT